MATPNRSQENEGEVLYGAKAIAGYLGDLSRRQIYHLSEKRNLPTFKIGQIICARRSSLARWLADQEAAGRSA